MFCHKCGMELPEGSLFCPGCGAQVAAPVKPVATEVPSRHAEIEPAKPKPSIGSKRRNLALVTSILALVVIVFVVMSNIGSSPQPAPTPQPIPTPQPVPSPGPDMKEVTAAENTALWNAANAALAQFIAEDIRSAPVDSVEPLLQANIELLSKLLNDFTLLVSQLGKVVPPDEHKPIHQTLLPIYSDMDLCMENIVKALRAGDQLAADTEWQNLALLVDEAASVTEMLSLTSEEYTPMLTPVEVVGWKPTVIPPLPAGTQPKPSSLLASDAEYFTLYKLYEDWGWDFISGYDKYTNEASSNNWTTFWMGSQDNENMRLSFDHVKSE